MLLEGKRVLVTGAGIGIGRGIALEMARQGADVVLSYYRSEEGAQSAVEEILALGHRAVAMHADLSQVPECFRLVGEAVEFLGGLDVLVNNAGVTLFKPFEEVTEADFDFLYGLNIRGQFFCAQRAARVMREQGNGGVIINILSVHALAGFPGVSVYSGTKGAIMAWTRALAVELAPYRIRVLGIAPGAIEVPRYYTEIKDYSAERMGKAIPWGRVGYPEDIGKVCAFLASEQADYIVGETVVVDGGLLARMAFFMEGFGET
ncbi:MAG: glucose 1-dehydrogenase [Anaerolineae bacterium]|nr:glucose 1-dehydrogenase [Anaerolineae bacterium]